MLWCKLKTLIEKVDAEFPENSLTIFETAAKIINSGGLVAFPTETVYGLGANALDSNAVKKIYAAKGRPSDNPLIVHISDISELYPIVSYISDKALKLIDAFWPGPLTLIFNKTDIIPYETSGGLNTVAIRFPSNKTAQLLIKQAAVPIAAPSANSSGKPSPTRASHVEFDLNGKIDMIIDGGSSKFGLESTIIDVSSEIPCILRPGSITKKMIEDVLGSVEVDKAVIKENAKPKAPGMKYKHYSPLANITIVSGDIENTVKKINSLAFESVSKNINTAIIATTQTENQYKYGTILVAGDRDKPETVAKNLFKILRKCDYLNIKEVYSESFDADGIEIAIMNRLKKAAGNNIIYV